MEIIVAKNAVNVTNEIVLLKVVVSAILFQKKI